MQVQRCTSLHAKATDNFSIVIPTYRRGEVLVRTLDYLLGQDSGAAEILVVDQTPSHPGTVIARLRELNESGRIRWIHLERPSITQAMNRGLLASRGDFVLFLDDDIVPSPGLVKAHAANYRDIDTWAVVGQILQPGQAPDDRPLPPYPGPGLWSDLEFPFNSTHRRQIYNCMAGNLSVRRKPAIAVGGMDENYQGVAYRFETDFARRLTNAGGRIMFDAKASLRHLQTPRGGTRSYGNHLTSTSPVHGVGDYYMAFRQSNGWQRWRYILRRLHRSVATRFHLNHPWWIPAKLVGEIRAMIWAGRLQRRGPRLISPGISSG